LYQPPQKFEIGNAVLIEDSQDLRDGQRFVVRAGEWALNERQQWHSWRYQLGQKDEHRNWLSNDEYWKWEKDLDL